MAIRAEITTIQGIHLESAYINFSIPPQIQKVKTDDGNIFNFVASAYIYSDEAAYLAGRIPVEGIDVTCPLDLSQNLLQQGYAALKLNERLSNMSDR